ncbi:MAG: hypothetical protein ACREE3_07125 [Stellaceae bacterium]
MLRAFAVLVGLLVAVPAMAGEMTAQEARHFVIGKVFHYSCFEGTRGEGRVMPDGAVVGSIQFQGHGRVHYAALPPGTLQVRGEAVCASLRGLPIHPCFNLERTDNESFHGSIAGLGFAYCDFTRHRERTHVAHRSHESNPLALRPSLTADRE